MVQEIYKKIIKVDELTDGEKMRFNKAVTCYICNKKFTDEKVKKVRDHCHLTGKYGGPAHNFCNLLFMDSTTTLNYF